MLTLEYVVLWLSYWPIISIYLWLQSQDREKSDRRGAIDLFLQSLSSKNFSPTFTYFSPTFSEEENSWRLVFLNKVDVIRIGLSAKLPTMYFSGRYGTKLVQPFWQNRGYVWRSWGYNWDWVRVRKINLKMSQIQHSESTQMINLPQHNPEWEHS